jgi:signal transduction histidine kinase
MGAVPSGRARLLALRLAPFGMAALFLAAVEALHGGGAGLPPVPALARASFEPLAPAAAPVELTLPHDWRATHPGAERARYRARVERDAPPESGLDLYLPSTDTSTRVRVNGVLVEEGEPFLALDSRLWHVPLYVAVPAALWRAGPNEVELELVPGRPGEGYLAPFFVGPRDALRPAYELRRFLQVTGVQVLVVAMVAFALFMGLLFALRRKEEAALWFAASLLVVAFGFWNLVTVQMWIAKPSWNWVGVAIPAWLVATLTLFTHRLLGLRRPRLELGLGAAVLAGTAFFAASAGSAAYHAARPAWGAAVLLFGLYPGFLTLRRALVQPDLEASLLLASGLVLNVAAVHDLGIANGAVPLEHDLAIAWAVVVGIALSAWIFVRRFIVALDTAEALTVELEQRVEEKHAELEANYGRLRELERERAVARERERLMAEIHDGLGGQLVSTLAMLRGAAAQDDVEAAVQGALDDMRLVIQSLETGAGDLQGALATLRARLGPRLRQAGLQVDWPVEDVPAPPGFGPEKALDVMRIVQEAVANVLKHAGARTLRVRAGIDGAAEPRRVVLRIEDDGGGMARAGAPAGASAGGGRGLANMRRRAARLGGELEVSSGPAGTRVRLVLPLA